MPVTDPDHAKAIHMEPSPSPQAVDFLSSTMQSSAIKSDQASPPMTSAMSTESMASPGSESVAGKKRKISNGVSSRGVSNMSPEKLARKRANDRQAQRAIRERTRGQIEALEQRIRELSSRKPYQDLQKEVAEKEVIQAENEDIKRRLAAVMDLIQPLLGKSGMIVRCNQDEYKADVRIVNNPGRSSARPETTYSSPLTDRNHDTPVSMESTAENPSQTHPPVPSLPRNDPQNFVNTLVNERLAFNDHGEKLVLNFLVDSPHQIPKIKDIRSLSDETVSAQPPRPDSHNLTDQPLAHMIPIRNVPATCPLDAIFLDFLHNRRLESQATEGTPRPQLAYPSVSSLLNPTEKTVYSYSISKVFADVLRTFPDISSLPEQAGVLYHMFLLMRWQIYPTKENYDRMPDWMTPRPAQLFTHHPAWIDYILWPKMRDRIVPDYQNYLFENWFIPYTRTISCNWPYEAADCLLHNTESDELLINPVFERHVRDLNNWTLGVEFAETFPALADAAKIKPEKKRRPSTLA